MRTDRSRARGGLGDVVAETIDALRDLIEKEIALFKAESAANLNKALVGGVAILAALVFAIVTISLLVEALVTWLAALWGSQVLAALFVAFGTAIVGAVLFSIGWVQLKSVSATPERTIRSVVEDVRTMTGQ